MSMILLYFDGGARALKTSSLEIFAKLLHPLYYYVTCQFIREKQNNI